MMRVVIIELDDKYDDLLSFTAVGASPGMLNSVTSSVKLSETGYVRVTATGQVEMR